jgi:hypothetical protein
MAAEKTEPKEAANSEDLRRLVDEVGTTIQRTLAESPQLAHCLQRVRAEGYEVSLVLEATIGFSRSDEADDPARQTPGFRLERGEPARIRMTPLDKKFLRSLKISVEEDETK